MAPHVYYFAVPPSDGLQALPFAPNPPTPPPPAMLISPLEQLQRELLVQIEYYFRYLFVHICRKHFATTEVILLSHLFNFCSDENLCKDIYLRKHMDDHGWVPLSLIAGFNQVSLQVLHCFFWRKIPISFLLYYYNPAVYMKFRKRSCLL